VVVRLSEQLKSARSQLDTLSDEKEHLQERNHIILEQTRRDLAVKHAECQEYKAKVLDDLLLESYPSILSPPEAGAYLGEGACAPAPHWR